MFLLFRVPLVDCFSLVAATNGAARGPQAKNPVGSLVDEIVLI